MGTPTLAAGLAAAAALLQLATVVLVARLGWRRAPRPLAAAVIAALTLMLVRRALAAHALMGATAVAPPVVAHEALGLLLSGLLLGGALALARRWTGPRAEVEDDGSSDALAASIARQEERELLCYDLHDGLAQTIYAARMHLDTYGALREQGGETPERELALAQRRLNEAAEEVGRIVSWLRLMTTPDACLSTAVGAYLTKLAAEAHWESVFEDRLLGRRFDPTIEATAYHIIQEALSNAARHAAARHVNVTLDEDGGMIVACVEDDGQGFDAEASPAHSGIGLHGMARRAELVGGTCVVRSRPGHGAIVRLRMPTVL